MGKTLWQLWMDKLSIAQEKTPEEKIYNPLELKIGSPVTINLLDWKDYYFFVKEIRENKREVGPPFTDYVLLARPLGGKDVLVRLRCFAKEIMSGELPYQPVLLTLYDEFEWNADFLKVVEDPSLKFDCFQDDVLTESFLRLGGLSDRCRSSLTVVREENGKIKDVGEGALSYWDYHRTGDEAGQVYLFVEMTEANHWFQIWKGEEVDPSSVILM